MRYSIHGLGVELSVQIPTLLEPLQAAIGEFSVDSLVGKHSPIRGAVLPFAEAQVVRHLSPTATRVTSENDPVELYEQDERFWRIDDQWGLCEINLLKGQFRSWILATSMMDGYRIIEQAVLWPTAQLLRGRGVCMIPAASVVRDGWGALLVSNFSLEPELRALVHAGFRVVGQTWTALRDESGKMTMLHLPGQIERAPAKLAGITALAAPHRVDITSEMMGSGCESGPCDAVLLIAPGRRPLPHLRPVSATNALPALRKAWPLVELHPQRRQGQFPIRLAQRARVFDVQLSRNASDVLNLLEAARYQRPQTPHASVLSGREVA